MRSEIIIDFEELVNSLWSMRDPRFPVKFVPVNYLLQE